MALVFLDLSLLSQRRKIAALALSLRVPTMFAFREQVEEGGLISYGVDLRESWRRAASFVDKIFKGSAPGDLPIEFPTRAPHQNEDRTGDRGSNFSIPTRPRRRCDRTRRSNFRSW
jgi:hypothetical protein